MHQAKTTGDTIFNCSVCSGNKTTLERKKGYFSLVYTIASTAITEAMMETAAGRGAWVVGIVVAATVAAVVGAAVVLTFVGVAVMLTVGAAVVPALKEVSLPYWFVAVRLTLYEPSNW
jgi:hypothetical protein